MDNAHQGGAVIGHDRRACDETNGEDGSDRPFVFDDLLRQAESARIEKHGEVVSMNGSTRASE